MREVDNAAAYMMLVTCNVQSELTPLERGLHALRSGMDIKAYANGVGLKRSTVHAEVCAAGIAHAVPDIRNDLSPHFSQLVEIHAAHRSMAGLVEAMLSRPALAEFCAQARETG